MLRLAELKHISHNVSRAMGNRALRSLLWSYPKKDSRALPANSSYVIPKEGLAGPRLSILFWYDIDNNKNLKACFLMTLLI